MQYRVRRGLAEIDGTRGLKLAGQLYPRGSVLDTADFPQFMSSDWKRWETHRLVEALESENDDRQRAIERQARIMARTRAEYSDATAESTDVALPGIDCPDCDFVAKTPHGLKVHVGRRHKE